MIAFLDFEASSLARRGTPVEVAWVFEDGQGESHLIRPAPDWTDWSPEAEAIHGLSRDTLERDGEPHGDVAHRMLQVLRDHAVFASAPSWDGKWMSVLLRASGLPRHALRLRDTDEARRAAALDLLMPTVPAGQLDAAVASILLAASRAVESEPPAHRALADARREHGVWLDIRRRATAFAASHSTSEDPR